MSYLEGRTAVVTGGASGIGFEIANQLRAAGASAVAWDIGGEAMDVKCDVSDPAEVERAYNETVERFGVPSILVTAAGFFKSSRVVDMDPAQWRKIHSVHVDGTLFAIKAIAGGLIEAGLDGSLLAVSSVNGTVCDAGLSAYSTAKAAINMLVRISAIELGPSGIRVNALAPGVTMTPMAVPIFANEGYKDELIQRTPLRRVGPVELVAQAALNVLSSEWVTGQIVAADGGSSLMTARRDWKFTGGDKDA